MDDCTSREAAIKILQDPTIDHKERAINRLPATKVKPVVRGEWKDEASEYDKTISERHSFVCPACGKEADYFIGGYGDWWCRVAPNLCPNCGADMRSNHG